MRCLAFSSDGTRLISGGEDKTVRVWDAEHGELLMTLGRHATRVLSVRFDDRTVVSVSADGVTKLWRVAE